MSGYYILGFKVRGKLLVCARSMWPRSVPRTPAAPGAVGRVFGIGVSYKVTNQGLRQIAGMQTWLVAAFSLTSPCRCRSAPKVFGLRFCTVSGCRAYCGAHVASCRVEPHSPLPLQERSEGVGNSQRGGRFLKGRHLGGQHRGFCGGSCLLRSQCVVEHCKQRGF